MRSPPTRAAGALLAAAAVVLCGCNAIFGLDEVFEKTPAGSGGTGGTAGTGGAPDTGGTGGGPLCPDPEVPGNLVANGSFEEQGAWQVMGGAAKLESVPAESCDLACGDLVGQLSGQTPAGTYTTLMLVQNIPQKAELGGTFKLRARYRYQAPTAPYFSLVGNGYDVGAPFIKGTPEGDHYVVSDFSVPVDDPRRTEDHVQLYWLQNLDDGEAVSLVDCVSLTYEPPPGTELLQNGWFESLTQGWQATGGTTLGAEDLQGLCGSVGALLTVPAATKGEAMRTTVEGPWPARTVFKFGGAAGTPLADPAPVLPPFSIVLHVDYADDMNSTTDDFEEEEVTGSTSSEPWEKATGILTAERPVTSLSVRLVVDNSASPSATTLLADCFTVRALP